MGFCIYNLIVTYCLCEQFYTAFFDPKFFSTYILLLIQNSYLYFNDNGGEGEKEQGNIQEVVLGIDDIALFPSVISQT